MPSTVIVGRIAAGFAIALVIAIVAHRTGSLSRSGVVAATLVGTAAVAAGWAWGALLVSYFVLSSALSHFRREEKERLTGSVVEKGSVRDATQVIANGGAFAVGALGVALTRGTAAEIFAIGALGALAAATADTWATEIGTLFGGEPRSILSFRKVAPGTSGGLSVAGVVAMIAGAAFVAYAAVALDLIPLAPLVVIAGVAGALIDSALGATLQERRWCASCERSTERGIHGCGATTSLIGGQSWMNNDMVNLLATMAGFGIAVLGLIV